MYTALSVTMYLLWFSPCWMSSLCSLWLKNLCRKQQRQQLSKISTWKHHSHSTNREDCRKVHCQKRGNQDSRTTSSEQLCRCMQSDLREVTKFKVRGWVLFQKLISRRTRTLLSTTASLITSSMADQYLLIQPSLVDILKFKLLEYGKVTCSLESIHVALGHGHTRGHQVMPQSGCTSWLRFLWISCSPEEGSPSQIWRWTSLHSGWPDGWHRCPWCDLSRRRLRGRPAERYTSYRPKMNPK